MSENEESGGPPPLRAVKGGRSQKSGGAGGTTPERRLLWLGAGLALLLLLGIILPFGAGRLADWLWYRDIGFERVFLTKIVAQWTLGLGVGMVAALVLFANVRAALRGAALDALLAETRFRPEARARAAVLTRLAEVTAKPGAVLLAFLIAVTAATQWRTAIAFFYRTPFGTTDPIFGRDVGYYVFTLPAIELALDYLTLVLLLGLALAFPIYIARGEIWRRGRGVTVQPAARGHLALLTAALLLLSAVRIHFVRVPSLLFADHAPFFGASYTDLHARLPALRILTVVTVVASALVLIAARRDRFPRFLLQIAVGYVAVVLLSSAVPALYQRLVVQANELARESPQIVHHIRSTRQAWAIDSVDRRELTGERRLSAADIAANRATIDNVRLWDREQLLQTFGQIQSIRTYYDFVAVDDDRYHIGGELRQVLLSARELSTDALPTRTFINEHLTYTHGMGLTLGPSNQVTSDGLPVLFVKDLPPVSSTSIRITRPQIYFGELASTFILAPTRQREFDYPAGEGGGDAAVYSAYGGRTGVHVSSLWRRALFAIRFGSLNILLSRDLTDSTRILYHRNVRERAERALPFLYFDRDPYLVVTDSGQLKWILDAYTASDRYPYAEPSAEGINYMRNAVKVVIDAYDGDVRAYLADRSDPIIRTLAKIYPGTLRPLDSLPADLKAHIRYPEDLFRAQTALYATYHMSDPETFYHREDQWQIPTPTTATPRGAPGAFIRHMVMRLPGERDPEFILMRPFTPRQKDNLAAWMVARNDGAHYGKLVLYRFPRQSLVFGPTQIVNRINQDPEVARQTSLWDQRGSEVVRGELLVLPIQQSLIYVQPLYLRAQGGRIPELKRVLVAHEGQVAMEESLDAGLARLFGSASRPRESGASNVAAATAPPSPAASTGDSLSATLLRQAMDHYERARAAQRADDWTTYGAEMRLLGEVLRRLATSPRQ